MDEPRSDDRSRCRGDRNDAGRFTAFRHAPSAAAGLLVFSAQVAPDSSCSGIYAMPLRRGRHEMERGGHRPSPPLLGAGGQERRDEGESTLASGSGNDALPWVPPRAVATLRSTNLTYILPSYNGFDGRCLAFYGSNDLADGVFVVDVASGAHESGRGLKYDGPIRRV